MWLRNRFVCCLCFFDVLSQSLFDSFVEAAAVESAHAILVGFTHVVERGLGCVGAEGVGLGVGSRDGRVLKPRRRLLQKLGLLGGGPLGRVSEPSARERVRVLGLFAGVFCQVVIGQCGVSFPSEKAVGFSPVRNWPVIARVLLFHCIRA